MKPGTEYELFVKDIYECLHKAEGLTDVAIQHDVKLTGLSGIPRQIDVFWSFKRAGIPYKVAIECKDYNDRVSIDKVSAFHDVLNDLQDVQGIIVSKVGFQKGALEWAKRYGIQARIIRHPTDEDWKGRMRNIHLQVNAFFVNNIRPTFVINKEKAGGLEIPSVFESDAAKVVITYDKIVDSDCHEFGASSTTMLDLINKLPRNNEPCKDKKYSYKFTNGILNGQYPIDEVAVTYDISVSTEHTAIYGDDLIKAIVKDIVSGQETIIDKFDRVSERKPLTEEKGT